MKYRILIIGLSVFLYTSVLGQNSNRLRRIAGRMKAKEAEILVPVGSRSMAMLYVQGGSFMMGNNSKTDEKPAHRRYISDLYVSKYEVTVGEYLEFCKETNSNLPEWLEKGNQYNVETGKDTGYKDLGYRRVGAERLPIVGVSWDNTVAYAIWLSSKTGVIFRLPTEAELVTERLSWTSNDASGAFDSPLKLPGAGRRFFFDGSIIDIGVGIYWSSLNSNNNARSLVFSGGYTGSGDYPRSTGASIRCIKD